MIQVETFRWYPTANKAQIKNLKSDLLRNKRKELVLVPDPENSSLYLGIVLSCYYSKELNECVGARNSVEEGDFTEVLISAFSVRGYVGSLARKMQAQQSQEQAMDDLFFDDLLAPDPATSEAPAEEEPVDPITQFLKDKTPAQIEQELNERVIGQKALTRAVADFLYYHALRQLHPTLPQRPLMIYGPSGSGKTEVWRAASQLYGNLFNIQVADGSSLSCDGWSGNFKLETFVTPAMVNGGILVVDEFDKLTTPKHSSGGDNVSQQMQAEFLKLIEGEYRLTEKKKQTNMTSKKMGFVLVGAFEELRAQKLAKQSKPAVQIGFCTREETPVAQGSTELSDEDFIRFGIMPEIVGRISTKCATKALDEQAYIDIIRGNHSRVAVIEQVLQGYGIQVSDCISNDELKEMIAASKNNRTGVRWVCAQVENRLLGAIREQGLFPEPCAH